MYRQMTMALAMPSFGIECNIHPVPDGDLAGSGLKGEAALLPVPPGAAQRRMQRGRALMTGGEGNKPTPARSFSCSNLFQPSICVRTGDEKPSDSCAVLQHDCNGCGVHAALYELHRAQPGRGRARHHRARGHQQAVALHHEGQAQHCARSQPLHGVGT